MRRRQAGDWAMADSPTSTQDALRAFALEFPEAFEDTPWDEAPVTKVRKKIFVFYGTDASPSIAVKLPESAELALNAPGATPTGYGLGRHGWVSVPLGEDPPPAGLLRDWVEESYRAVAPKTLVRRLDEAGTAGVSGP
jgi:predicted DNA-binding protein (MmcQ/YjbR family)